MAANGIMVMDETGVARPASVGTAIINMLSATPTDEFHWNKPSMYRLLVRVLPAKKIDLFIQAYDPPYSTEMAAARDDAAKRIVPPSYSAHVPPSSNEAVLRDILADLTALQRKVTGLVASIEGRKK